MPKFKVGDIVKPSEKFLSTFPASSVYYFVLAQVTQVNEVDVEITSINKCWPVYHNTWWYSAIYLELVCR